MTIRNQRFSSKDIHCLLDLLNQANKVDQAGWFFSAKDILEALEKEDPIPALDRIWLIFQEDLLVGYYRLASEWIQDGLKTTCFGCVHPAYRQQGIGTHLLQHALATAAQYKPKQKLLNFQVPARRSVAGIYEVCEQNGLSLLRQFTVLKRRAELPTPDCQTTWKGKIWPFDLNRDAANLLKAFLICFSNQLMSIELLQAEWKNACNQGGQWWVAYDQHDSFCGFCLVTAEKEDQEEVVGLIDYLGVLPTARRQGLGRMLLFEAVRHFQYCGVSEIKLATEVDNLRALNLYFDAGFESWREARLYQIKI